MLRSTETGFSRTVTKWEQSKFPGLPGWIFGLRDDSMRIGR